VQHRKMSAVCLPPTSTACGPVKYSDSNLAFAHCYKIVIGLQFMQSSKRTFISLKVCVLRYNYHRFLVFPFLFSFCFIYITLTFHWPYPPSCLHSNGHHRSIAVVCLKNALLLALKPYGDGIAWRSLFHDIQSQRVVTNRNKRSAFSTNRIVT
jgi:hypothetical protein